MHLKAIGAKNFLGYKELSLKVRSGLTLIDGVNRHFAAASSGGSGKSSINEVIAFGSFGKTIRDITKDGVIHNGREAGAEVWNDYVQDSGRLLRVVHYRGHRKYGNEARLLEDSKDKMSGRTINDTNRRISRRLGFDFDLFKRAIVLHSRFTGSFTDVNDRYLKMITEKLIGMPDFEPLLKRVKEKIDSVLSSIESIFNTIKMSRHLIDEKKESLQGYRKQSKKFEAKQKKVRRKAEEELSDYQESLEESQIMMKRLKKKLKSENRLLVKLERKVEHANEALRLAERISSAFDKEVIKKKERRDLLNELSVKFHKMRGKVCPECGQKVSAKHVKSKVFARAKEFSDLVNWIALSKVTESRNMKAMDAAQDALNKYESKTKACSRYTVELEGKIDSYKMSISACKDFISKMRKRVEEVNPYRKLIKDVKASIQSHKKKIEQLKSKRDKRKKTLLYYDFWKRGFGPNGIRSYILDAVNPVLNRIANIYLDFLMEGTMSVTLRTVRQKKDGTYSDKFEVVIENMAGADTMGGSCDNELSAVDFSLNLAMSDILESRIQGGFGFLFVDQALDAFDTVRSGKAVQLLKNKLNKQWCEKNKVPHKRSIWVITHKDQIKGLFDNKIMVEKRRGVCRIVQ